MKWSTDLLSASQEEKYKNALTKGIEEEAIGIGQVKKNIFTQVKRSFRYFTFYCLSR
jgi:hypothetical protein